MALIDPSPFNISLQPATSELCELGLFLNNKKMVHSFCNFRFVENSIQPQILELNPTTILVYKISLISLNVKKTKR